jgi:hypothetical protein
MSSFPYNGKLAQSNLSNNFMSLYTPEGIFYITPSAKIKTYSSGYVAAEQDYYTTAILHSNDEYSISLGGFVGSPLFAVNYNIGSATSHYSFLLGTQGSTDVCGDHVCAGTETVFNCPSDCSATSSSFNGSCVSSYDCTGSAFDSCLNGVCVFGLTNTSCISNNGCNSTSPLCCQGYCIGGASINVQGYCVSGGSTIESDTEINDMFNILFQGQSWLKFLFGMIMTIMIAIWAGEKSKGNAFVVSLAAFFGLVISTILGFIPVYVVILLVLIMILLVGLGKVLFPNNPG